MHADRGRSVTALCQRKGRMSDRVGHQITNDDNTRHVVTTLLPGLSQGSLTAAAPGSG